MLTWDGAQYASPYTLRTASHTDASLSQAVRPTRRVARISDATTAGPSATGRWLIAPRRYLSCCYMYEYAGLSFADYNRLNLVKFGYLCHNTVLQIVVQHRTGFIGARSLIWEMAIGKGKTRDCGIVRAGPDQSTRRRSQPCPFLPACVI